MKYPADWFFGKNIHPMGGSKSLGRFHRATGVGCHAEKRLSFRGIDPGGKVIRRFRPNHIKKS